MLKFMKHQQKLTPERIQKQKELFAFHKACYHGFPAKPSALAWDPLLRLLAIATKSGHIRIYGKPGVEFYGHNEESDSAITHLTFLHGQCRMVSLCEDNSLHLWQLTQQSDSSGVMHLRLIKSTRLEGKLKKISVVVADSECYHLLVGTEGGNIYLLDLTTFTMSDNIIYQDVVMQNVPEDYKVNPGPVEAISPHPTSPDKLLIGYQRGLIVLWDKKNLCADQTYVCSQQLESLCWQPDASHFTSCHNDGSYLVWSAQDSRNPAHGPHTVYGPFPCKPITKILTPPANEGDDLIVFSGGMPRASYGDRNTVTVMQGDQHHVTFTLTSKVLDFVVVIHEEAGHATCLVILAEEEVVFIDLESEDWPPLAAPYLASLHSSAITCSLLASDVASEVYSKIKNAGSKQHSRLSPMAWPINGGTLNNSDIPKQKDILLTGHEDGTVQFWDASGVSLTLLYKLSTSQLFVSEDLGGDGAAAEDDDWPPFRKAGLFDPYSDDPRLGVKKVSLCPHTGTLAVAGTAGQVLLMEISTEEKTFVPECAEVNLVAETDNFVWKSHSKLDRRTEPIKFDPGMQPTSVVQFYPPASCTSLALHSEWGLVACGTAHGFALYDIIQKRNLLAKSTLSPLDLANAADEGPMSRRKSLKKSLRESFRRLRRGRSQRKTGRPGATSPPPAGSQPQSPDDQDDYDFGVGEEVLEVSDDNEEEGEEGTELEGRGESGGGQGGGGGGEMVEAPLSPPEDLNINPQRNDDDAIEVADDDDIIIEEAGRQDGEDEGEEEPKSHDKKKIKSKKKEKKDKEEQDLEPLTEPVPFFYYITPKKFRSSMRKGEVGTPTEMESRAPVAVGEEEEGTVSSPAAPQKTGFSRLREWMHRGEVGEEMAKVEGVEPSESREGSLRRFLKRTHTPVLDHSPVSEPQASSPTLSTGQSPVESVMSRRQKLRLIFRHRQAASEENVQSTESPDLPPSKDKEVQSKPGRPRKLFLRSQSERKPSPDQPTVSSLDTPSTEPLGASPEKEKQKRSFQLSFTSFRRQQETEDTKKKLDTPKEPKDTKGKQKEEMTTSETESKPGPSFQAEEGVPEGRIKRFFRQQSEVILRPFSKRTTESSEKRISAPPATQEATVEISDLEARHPSISTYIDETPTVPVAPPLPVASSSLAPPSFSSAPPSPSAPLPPTIDPPSQTLAPPAPSSAPPSPSQESSKVTGIQGETKPASSDLDSPILDLHNLRSTPDIARKIISSQASALSRKLTFTLPFGSSGGGEPEEGVRSVERAVEARSHASDYIGSMVRCLHLTKCFIANSQNMSATLWAGTNSGAIYVFTVAVPPSEKRAEVPLTVQLGKEIHLKHGAPVISICILDGVSHPFPAPMAVKKEAAAPPNPTLPHRVLICSEEQFKVFTLPQLKPFCKFKLTAHEGSRVRKIDYADFISSVDASYHEPGFIVVTNQGDLSVFSLPDCRRQIMEAYLKKEDITGISSVVFSNRGEGLYLTSPCELERVSLSARVITRPTGNIAPIRSPPSEHKPEEPTQKTNEEAEGASATAPAVAVPTTPNTPASELGEQPADASQKSEEAEAAGKEEKGDGAMSVELPEEGSGEKAVDGGKKAEEVRENGDNSVLSGDITIDSIRDHMDELKVAEKGVVEVKGGGGGGGAGEGGSQLASTSTSSTTTTGSSVTVVKTTTITAVSSSSQESSSVQVVESTSTEVNHTAVNGTE